MFPNVRPRRLRRHPRLRDLIRETHLTANDFILPLFVRHGENQRIPIASMPGQSQLSVDLLAQEVKEIEELGIPAVILFGIPEHKDATGSDAVSDDGIVQQAVRAIKAETSNLLVMTDVCFCEFTDHGHCGIVNDNTGMVDVDNDATLRLLAREAVSHAEAGADLVAPSGMMDGMIETIRMGLDDNHFEHIPIMSYAAKYQSAFYGPFRDAAESAPQFGNRATYQMDPANGREAIREVDLDVEEGADILMVKPALSYLDIITRVKEAHSELPLAAYNVSGEFSMVKAAAAQGWIDERQVALEVLTSIKRAGADMIITYFAKDASRWLDD
ncbi:Delta-aminolevulinic acid dehydratase [Thalassoglobus neptunius]|uniref:Delta-aminolevulinic acid dehydratase n=1 Tax=Thalassoglobus neptunius TaxID=1938619 RepID=A0A5C5WAE7_9PLAN|nr:porphobilinogen synthase [Thalassoglobus neptunius]TWT47135.1 Delta-aminolevulinic acid dehydratase [Thalassoglobus neptunius]